MVIWLQRGVICMKTFFKNLTFTFLCLGISTILAFFFFNLGQKNSVNTALIYILALILIAQNTTSYWYGAAASVFCVIAANYFFTYPYFKLKSNTFKQYTRYHMVLVGSHSQGGRSVNLRHGGESFRERGQGQ